MSKVFLNRLTIYYTTKVPLQNSLDALLINCRVYSPNNNNNNDNDKRFKTTLFPKLNISTKLLGLG